jgi:hypothetical protein
LLWVVAFCKSPSILRLITAKHSTLPVLPVGLKYTVQTGSRSQALLHRGHCKKPFAFTPPIKRASQFQLHFRINRPI